MSPKGFWSYARGDDSHLDGVLTGLRERIAGEVSMLLGHDIGIFQDIHDLRTGDDWEAVLRAAVGEASFLIPVLTPRFFNRPWCREEVLTYLRICGEKGVAPRIFPIRFVELDDDEDCAVRAALKPYQFKDLSQWRFESDPTQKARLVYEFAKDVKAKLRVAPLSTTAVKAEPELVSPSEAAQLRGKKTTEGPTYKTYIVDPFPGRGDYTSIGSAITAALAGSKIVVRPGTYRESLGLSKVLEIMGDGDRERIVVVTDRDDVLHCDAPMARISGLSFRREAGGEDYAIWITGGSVEIEDCILESRSKACVGIGGLGTSPSLRRCLIRNGAKSGMVIHDGASPVLEDCEMLGSGMTGVQVSGAQTRPILRRCISRNGMQGGFYFYDRAGGIMERCEASGNAHSGVEIKSGANPSLTDCIMRDNHASGLFVNESGRGRLRGCEIKQNKGSGVFVQESGTPEVMGCTLTGNSRWGIEIKDPTGGGIFRGNDLTGNARGAWSVAVGAKLERTDNKG